MMLIAMLVARALQRVLRSSAILGSAMVLLLGVSQSNKPFLLETVGLESFLF